MYMAVSYTNVSSFFESLGPRMLCSKYERIATCSSKRKQHRRQAASFQFLPKHECPNNASNELLSQKLPPLSPKVYLLAPKSISSSVMLTCNQHLLLNRQQSRFLCRHMHSVKRMEPAKLAKKISALQSAFSLGGIEKIVSKEAESLSQKFAGSTAAHSGDWFAYGTIAKLNDGVNQCKAHDAKNVRAEIRREILRVMLAGVIFYILWNNYKSIMNVNVKLNSSFGFSQSTSNVEGKGQGIYNKVSFAEIVGCDEAKKELEDIVSYLKDPSIPTALGGKVPAGVLVVGKPGVGKSMIARAVATEAGVPFFYASGSNFDEVFVGVGSQRVRELFQQARKNAPSVIFIDEIDAVGGKRSDKGGSLRRQTINQLLSEMDGFKPTDGVVVIGATNLGHVLDPALTRSGRFDSKVVIEMPDSDGRMQLLQHYLSRVKADSNINVQRLANNLINYAGAHIENLINQAALRAANVGAASVNWEHIDWARTKLELGRERRVFTDKKELRNTAYHEAAHTLVAHQLKLPIFLVTIERRGHTGGHMRHDVSENYNTREELLSHMAVSLAGKMGEEVADGTGQHTSGCSSDYESVTNLAREFVMSGGLGSTLYSASADGSYNPSQYFRAKVDAETKVLLDNAKEVAQEILSRESKRHHKLANALLQKHTLSKEEVHKILD